MHPCSFQIGSDLYTKVWKAELVSKGRKELSVRGMAQTCVPERGNFDIKILFFLVECWLLL